MVNFASLDLNLLRVLDAVATEGSTVRAGERIGLSQPAVSNALSRLRHALNDDLFVRQGQRLVPTDFTRSIAQPLREELDRLSMLLDGAGAFDPADLQATFRIAGNDFFGEMLMPALMERLGTVAPDVRVQLIDLARDSFVGTLDRMGAELALLPNGIFPEWTVWQPLFHSSFAVIARRGHSKLAGLPEGAELPLDLFCKLPHVIYSPEGNLSAMGDEALSRIGRRREVRATVPSFSAVCVMVERGDFLALLPQQFASAKARQYDLTIYRPPISIAPPLIGALWHRRSDGSPSHKWFRGEISAILAPLNRGEALIAR
jgi:DNA-binding transcriptional LysR family regulator